jgi:hypothetical protein
MSAINDKSIHHQRRCPISIIPKLTGGGGETGGERGEKKKRRKNVFRIPDGA